MKPIIGIVTRPSKDDIGKTASVCLDGFRRALITNGAVPIGIIPPQDVNYVDTKGSDIGLLTDEDKEVLIRQIELCDGIIFQGGNRWYSYDVFICDYCIKHNIPSLYICMSMQLLGKTDMMNNEDMRQLIKIEGHKSELDYVHDVTIKKDSILFDILGKEKIKVNSRHSYSLPTVYNYDVVAKSDDGIIEGIERKDKRFILGLQWHPEMLYSTDEDQNRIFKYFIDKCKH